MDNLLGKNLGRYQVIEPLGQGGMATVYKAFDTSLERNVAIKIIRTDRKEGTEQNEFLKRFQREAKALAQLDHPYILKVLDYGEQEGMPYLVMPFVRGGTLKEKMGRPMPYQEAAALLAPIAQALDYAHQRKIIHRDVKPANILIGETNTPLLSDFGIAKIIESGESTQLTATGVGIGTPDYMAPEQWLGKADARTDIYALGIVFFQMVTGRLPYSAETPAAVLIKHMQDPLPRPKSFVPALPDAVEQVIFKALAKDPVNRYQDMGAFAAALGKLAAGDQTVLASAPQGLETVWATMPAVPVPVPAPSQLETVRAPAIVPPMKRKRIAVWVIGLIVLGIVAVLAFLAVLAGGAYLASRMASQLKLPTSVPGMVETVAGVPPSSRSAALEPTPTQATPTQSTPTQEPSSTSAPFQSIDGFPADIPILKDNDGNLLKTSTQGMTMYTFSTNLSFQQVMDFYKSGMDTNGWQVMSNTSQTGMQMWNFTKGDSRQVMIAITAESNKPVQVSIILQ